MNVLILGINAYHKSVQVAVTIAKQLEDEEMKRHLAQKSYGTANVALVMAAYGDSIRQDHKDLLDRVAKLSGMNMKPSYSSGIAAAAFAKDLHNQVRAVADTLTLGGVTLLVANPSTSFGKYSLTQWIENAINFQSNAQNTVPTIVGNFITRCKEMKMMFPEIDQGLLILPEVKVLKQGKLDLVPFKAAFHTKKVGYRFKEFATVLVQSRLQILTRVFGVPAAAGETQYITNKTVAHLGGGVGVVTDIFEAPVDSEGTYRVINATDNSDFQLLVRENGGIIRRTVASANGGLVVRLRLKAGQKVSIVNNTTPAVQCRISIEDFYMEASGLVDSRTNADVKGMNLDDVAGYVTVDGYASDSGRYNERSDEYRRYLITKGVPADDYVPTLILSHNQNDIADGDPVFGPSELAAYKADLLFKNIVLGRAGNTWDAIWALNSDETGPGGALSRETKRTIYPKLINTIEAILELSEYDMTFQEEYLPKF